MSDHLKHKLVPTKMRIPTGHGSRSRLSLSLRIPSNLSLDAPESGSNTPLTPYNSPLTPHTHALVRRSDDTETMTPTIVIGICVAGGMCVVLAILLFVRQQRKKTRKNTAQPSFRSIERGIVNAKRSIEEGSDDTHVVDFVYGEKVRSSFESSDYHAFSNNGVKAVSRSAITNSVILPTPVAALTTRAQPNLKAIDVGRANNFNAIAYQDPSPLIAPVPPAMFPGTPSSVGQFYGPAIARARTESDAGRPNLPQTSAMRALAIAAGIASTPTSPAFDQQQLEKKGSGTLDLPIELSRFRESTFGDGMKLGQHLGIKTGKDEEEERRSQDVQTPDRGASTPNKSANPPAPGSRPGTAGTFGQPAGGPFSFGSRVPYKTHRHAASSISIADVRSVRVSYASGQSSPLAGGFPQGSHSPHGSVSRSHGRTQSTSSNVITRKVLTVFPPLLPDELVLGVGEKVTLLQTFDDEWCVVGRDRFGEVEVGAVPAYVFTKVRTGEKMERPMRSTSLGVQVEMSSAPGAHFSSRDEVISWSNF